MAARASFAPMSRGTALCAVRGAPSVRPSAAVRVAEASREVLKNALSAAPAMVRLRRLLRGSPFGGGHMDAASWRQRRLGQVREVLEAYQATWTDFGWLAGRSVLELGSGDDAAVPYAFAVLGGSRAVAADVGVNARPALDDDLGVAVERLVARYGATLPDARARLHAFGGVTAESVRDEVGVPFDLLVSVSALEHVGDPERAVAEMYRCVRPGGRMVHSIATGNHCCGAGEVEPLAHLTFPAWVWKHMWSRRVGHNRLRWFQWEALLVGAGFRVMRSSISRTPPEEIARVRGRLAPQFAAMTDEELAPSYVVVCCERGG
jgi:SAM-dependent methyltransferase